MFESVVKENVTLEIMFFDPNLYDMFQKHCDF